MATTQPALELPDRIWIVGPCGAGKSTVARMLAERMGVAPTHMDELHWLPDWVERKPDETGALLAPIVASPRWVIDGNYGSFRQPHMDRVQLTVWLDLPLRVTFSRLLRRGLRRSLRGEACCNGNHESLRRTFWHKDSLLLYALQTHRRRRRDLTAELATRPYVRLRSQREVERWLATVGCVNADHAD
ncbi:MAG: AAA family ATPase [Planctomycetota bacterium]|nr:AAA family ATPase [Planctomycetota bacterium]